MTTVYKVIANDNVTSIIIKDSANSCVWWNYDPDTGVFEVCKYSPQGGLENHLKKCGYKSWEILGGADIFTALTGEITHKKIEIEEPTKARPRMISGTGLKEILEDRLGVKDELPF